MAKKTKRKRVKRVIDPSSYWLNLPFCDATRKDKNWHWNPPKTKDYGEACRLGAMYVWDVYHYLRNQPSMVGYNFMQDITMDMRRYKAPDAMNGYAVGFFAELERFIAEARITVNIVNGGAMWDRKGLKR